jgi:aminopeptidase N
MLGAPRPFVLSGTARVYERPRPFVIRHLALEIELDTANKSVIGVATIDVERVDSDASELCLDAVGFEIESAAFVGKKRSPARHVYDGNIIRIPIGEDVRTAKIRIAYRATPARGIYFLEPDEHVQDRPRQVWTQGQDEDARHWSIGFRATTNRTPR